LIFSFQLLFLLILKKCYNLQSKNKKNIVFNLILWLFINNLIKNYLIKFLGQTGSSIMKIRQALLPKEATKLATEATTEEIKLIINIPPIFLIYV